MFHLNGRSWFGMVGENPRLDVHPAGVQPFGKYL